MLIYYEIKCKNEFIINNFMNHKSKALPNVSYGILSINRHENKLKIVIIKYKPFPLNHYKDPIPTIPIITVPILPTTDINPIAVPRSIVS